MFNKNIKKLGVPPMYCYLFIFIFVVVLVYSIRKHILKSREGLDINSDKKSIVYCIWMVVVTAKHLILSVTNL